MLRQLKFSQCAIIGIALSIAAPVALALVFWRSCQTLYPSKTVLRATLCKDSRNFQTGTFKFFIFNDRYTFGFMPVKNNLASIYEARFVVILLDDHGALLQLLELDGNALSYAAHREFAYFPWTFDSLRPMEITCHVQISGDSLDELEFAVLRHGNK